MGTGFTPTYPSSRLAKTITTRAGQVTFWGSSSGGSGSCIFYKNGVPTSFSGSYAQYTIEVGAGTTTFELLVDATTSTPIYCYVDDISIPVP